MLGVHERISAPQLVFILMPLIIATELMSVPGIIYQYAQEDSWASYLLSSVTGLWTISVYTILALRHPGKTMIQYSKDILGVWIGMLIGLYMMYNLFVYVCTVSDELMSFITLFATPRTPRLLTLSILIGVCAVGAWLGIEVLARSSELLIPLNIIFVTIVSLLLIPNMTVGYLRPVFSHGLLAVFQGAVVPSAWTGEFFVLGFLLPFVNDQKRARSFSYLALGAILVIMSFIIIVTITVDGPLTGQLKYAYYSAVRYVSIGDFLERIDPVILGVWVYGGFIKLAVLLWTFALCTAQVFSLSNYRMIILPLTLLCIVGSLWVFSNAFQLTNFLTFTYPVAGFVSNDILPTLILIVDIIRNRKRDFYEQVAS